VEVAAGQPLILRNADYGFIHRQSALMVLFVEYEMVKNKSFAFWLSHVPYGWFIIDVCRGLYSCINKLLLRGNMKKQYGVKNIILTVALLCAPLTVPAMTSAGEDVSSNLTTLLKTKSCRECALQGVNLNRADLAGADLEGADLTGAKLQLANLAGANLKNCNLQGAVFGGADLAGADLRGARLTKTTLDGAYLAGALLQEPGQSEKNEEIPVAVQKDVEPVVVAQVEEVETEESAEAPPVVGEVEVFQEKNGDTAEEKVEIDESDQPATPAADSAPPSEEVVAIETLSEKTGKAENVDEPMTAAPVVAQEEEVQEQPVEEKTEVVAEQVAPLAAAPEVQDVTAGGGDQQEVDKEEPVVDEKAVAKEKLLDSKKCYGCDLSGQDLSGASLKNGDLEKANLSDCNLSGANLSKSNLKGAMIRNANLSNADLRGADLYKADLSGSDLTGADLEGAIFEDTQLAGVTGMVK